MKNTIGNNVKIYQNVTLGRADIWQDSSKSKFKSIHIGDGAIICAGAKVICKKGTLRVGKNTIIGANAVLTCSTGDNEIWAGIPAKKITEDERKLIKKILYKTAMLKPGTLAGNRGKHRR